MPAQVLMILRQLDEIGLKARTLEIGSTKVPHQLLHVNPVSPTDRHECREDPPAVAHVRRLRKQRRTLLLSLELPG